MKNSGCIACIAKKYAWTIAVRNGALVLAALLCVTMNRIRFVLPLAFLVSCVSAPSPVAQIVLASGSNVTPDQLRALEETLTAHPPARWVEIREVPAQMVGRSGRSTVLTAEALHVLYEVTPHLCHGRLTLFWMRDEDFDTNTWKASPGVLFGTYDQAGTDPCVLAREKDRRFWFAGVSPEELAGVLEAFTGKVPNDDAAWNRPTLLPGERIIQIKRKPTGSGGPVIEVHTVDERDDHRGRVIQFERHDGLWTGRVTGGWIA